MRRGKLSVGRPALQLAAAAAAAAAAARASRITAGARVLQNMGPLGVVISFLRLARERESRGETE